MPLQGLGAPAGATATDAIAAACHVDAPDATTVPPPSDSEAATCTAERDGSVPGTMATPPLIGSIVPPKVRAVPPPDGVAKPL